MITKAMIDAGVAAHEASSAPDLSGVVVEVYRAMHDKRPPGRPHDPCEVVIPRHLALRLWAGANYDFVWLDRLAKEALKQDPPQTNSAKWLQQDAQGHRELRDQLAAHLFPGEVPVDHLLKAASDDS
jgi:hypothetical protein